MRWIFLAVIILLFELLTYEAGRGISWWLTSLSPAINAQSLRWVMISLFVLSNALLVFGISRVTSIGLKVAMTWLTVMWFIILAMIAVGIIQLVLAKFAPQWLTVSVQWLLPLWVLGLMAIGVYNAYVPTVHHVTITANQPLAKPIRLAMVSDLHLGWLVGNRQLEKLTEIVKNEKVELLLIPGDIMDDDIDYYQRLNMKPTLQQLVQSVPMGVIASLGNHDMYGHEAKIRQALTDAGVKVLGDETVAIDDKLWLIARLDNHARHRKTTAELMPKTLDKPIILLDHEPDGIEKNVQLPIDLQLSGHTHNGQIFPANFIVKALNRLAYGHERINNTDVIVSSGYGFWGVPFRLGSQAEVWVIDLVSKK